MKTILEYLNTKNINKSKLSKGDLNKKYDNIYILVDDLNEFFGERLKKPIKVIKTETLFKPIDPYSKDGIYVKEHFIIEFNKTTTKLRFGYRNDAGLMVQAMYKDYKGKSSVGTITRYKGYQFGTNFLEWLESLQGTNWKHIPEIFGLKK